MQTRKHIIWERLRKENAEKMPEPEIVDESVEEPKKRGWRKRKEE